MSTKKLERTVIEGGRYNTTERRNSHKYNRAAEKLYVHNVILDPEYAEGHVAPVADPICKEFSDKLSAMYRWLNAQVGRPWSEVRSEIAKKFDTSTTAGRHITYDHLLRSIVATNSGWDRRGNNLWDPESKRGRYRHDYYVNQDGILTQGEGQWKRWRSANFKISDEYREWFTNFMAGRMIAEKGGKLYWLAPSEGVWRTTIMGNEWSNHVVYQLWEAGKHITHVWGDTFHGYFDTIKVGWGWETIENPFSFRQRGELTPDEKKCFNALPERIRDKILDFSAGRI